jgi:hypothetical protein
MNALERGGTTLLISALCGCSGIAPAEKVNIAEMDDNSLSCTEIEAKVKHMDEVIANAENAQMNQAVNQAATEVGVAVATEVAKQALFGAGAYNFGSLFGMSSPSIRQVQGSSQPNAQQTSSVAEQRKQYLVALYNRKGCTAEHVVPLVLDKETVRIAQQQLKWAGFDPGLADGVMGARTLEAVRKYQESQGLPVTGKRARSRFPGHA